MRIISGALKGRSINFLKNLNTRPLKDSIKENIFNILKHSNLIKVKIKSSNILDLYSGIGSFGIECISRGADKVTFIENNLDAGIILKENLTQLSIINRSKIHIKKVENALTNDISEKFHVFFFDPPFKDSSFLQNIKLIQKKKVFKKNHVIIIHREKKAIDDFKNLITIIEIKKYGRSKVLFGVFN